MPLKDAWEEGAVRQMIGVVPTVYSISGPKTVPRVDYERIFVLDERLSLLGEYALRDECPLEYADLRRTMPVSGLRHLVTFYQGEYAFTPFRVEEMWFVLLTRGVPRIEDRGSIGTLLAAMRLHLPAVLAPALAEREAVVRRMERELEDREASLTLRDQRVSRRESDLQTTSAKLRALEAEIRSRETKLDALRDYALQMQTSFRKAEAQGPAPEGKERSPRERGTSVPPP